MAEQQRLGAGVAAFDGESLETSTERWVWYLHPFQSRRVPRHYVGSVDSGGRRTLVEKPRQKVPKQPLKLAVEPGAIVTQIVERVRPPRVRTLETDKPLEPSRVVKFAIALYAPTDRELALVQSWGYDPTNPDWQRFAGELEDLSHLAGTVMPSNWRVSAEWQNRTASRFVELMAGLKRPNPVSVQVVKPDASRGVVGQPPKSIKPSVVTVEVDSRDDAMTPAKNLADRFEKAYQSYKAAEQELLSRGADTVTDRQAWEHLNEQGFDGYEQDRFKPPPFERWQRYLRDGRRFHDDRKNTPRGGREGGSMVRSDETDTLKPDDGE